MGYRVYIGFREYKDTGIQEIKGYRNTSKHVNMYIYREYKDTGIQGYRDTRIQEY